MVKPVNEHISPSRWVRILILATCTIMVVFVIIRITRRSTPNTAEPSIHSRQVIWACESNPAHNFRNHFRFEAMKCQICGNKCAIRLHYICPKHEGPFETLVRFARNTGSNVESASPTAVVSQYRYANTSKWHLSNGTVTCPEPECNLIGYRAKTAWSNTMPNATDPE